LSSTIGFSQGNECDTLENCQEALKANPKSSLAHYRLGEVFFRQKNRQSAALEFFDALKGDLDPKWTEVWSHVNLGKIYDVTQQRDRAVREYRLAEQTKDNTRGALDEAAKYLKLPYKGE
jgi:tetratricopeptide (TPR) repeat protein